MSEKSINFDDKKINKSNFYKNKKVFKIEDIDINKILVSKKESYGTKNSSKYFIGYNDDDDVIRPLCVNFLQLIVYVKHFDSNKAISFRASDNKLLRKYNKISYKCLSLIMLDSVIIANEKYPQTLLEECKYEIKMENLINDDLDPSSSDESENESDNEFDNGSDNETDN